MMSGKLDVWGFADAVMQVRWDLRVMAESADPEELSATAVQGVCCDP